MFANLRKDFEAHNREFFNWGFRAMMVYRFGRWRYGVRPRFLRLPFSAIYKYLYFRMKAKGIELPCEVEVGEGFRIDHQGGIVISGYAKIGKNCVVRNGVTIGLARADDPAAPTIGDDVDIGAGAKLLGRIAIGNGVRIGANAVVITDIPSGATAVGVPAKVVRGGGAGAANGAAR
jgi:serine O-acetyltransferase